MHQDTKRELIEQGTGVVGSLLKEMLVHRNEIEVLREQKEKEVELAKARSEASQDTGDERTDSHQPAQGQVPSEPQGDSPGVVQATPGQIEDALDELIEEEMCSICRELLIALKERPTSEQVRGIMEYGTFKKELGDGAGVEELKALLKETDVLQSIFQEKFNGA